jgi:hypothetical protein
MKPAVIHEKSDRTGVAFLFARLGHERYQDITDGLSEQGRDNESVSEIGESDHVSRVSQKAKLWSHCLA